MRGLCGTVYSRILADRIDIYLVSLVTTSHGRGSRLVSNVVRIEVRDVDSRLR